MHSMHDVWRSPSRRQDLKGELVRKVVIICCLAAVLAISAVAQTPDRGRGTGDLYFGYTHLSGDVGKNGWNASGTWNFNRYVGAEGDLAGYYGSSSFAGIASADESEYSFLVGPKVRFETSNPKVIPWGHFLFGYGHNATTGTSLISGTSVNPTESSFAWALGGGGDWVFRPQWAARAKLDLLHNGFSVEGGSHIRFGLGVVYRWGGQ